MSVAVIIPTLNEAHHIQACVARLRHQGATELVVVDGGSTDATATQARDADKVLISPPGRALQMNTGALHARGDVLLFLHADCHLDDTALADVPRLLARSGVIAGCFTQRVHAEGWRYRWIDACATARAKLAGLPYGDQGLFIKRATFHALGGFPAVRFLEDVMFSQVLRRQGRIAVSPARVWVSARRWQRTGILRQSLRNWTLTALALLGVPPDCLARYYPVVR